MSVSVHIFHRTEEGKIELEAELQAPPTTTFGELKDMLKHKNPQNFDPTKWGRFKVTRYTGFPKHDDNETLQDAIDQHIKDEEFYQMPGDDPLVISKVDLYLMTAHQDLQEILLSIYPLTRCEDAWQRAKLYLDGKSREEDIESLKLVNEGIESNKQWLWKIWEDAMRLDAVMAGISFSKPPHDEAVLREWISQSRKKQDEENVKVHNAKLKEMEDWQKERAKEMAEFKARQPVREKLWKMNQSNSQIDNEISLVSTKSNLNSNFTVSSGEILWGQLQCVFSGARSSKHDCNAEHKVEPLKGGTIRQTEMNYRTAARNGLWKVRAT